MTMEVPLARSAPPDALRHRPEAASEVGSMYAAAVTRIAQAVIYNKIPLTQLEQDVVRARMNTAVNGLEKEAHSLEALVSLFKGIEAQEVADKISTKAWQAALLKQPITHREEPVSPEKLSREEVAKEFQWFDLRKDLLEAEDKALNHYKRFLELNGDHSISVTDTIQLKRVDIEILVMDLEVRQTERILDPDERKVKLLELNRGLARLIKGLMDSREDAGKCLELQEMYLFRRLVYMADTGHLASISHGNPRQDLKRHTRDKERSIDMVISLAGEAPLHLQMKTFKADVDTQARWDQHHRLEDSREHLDGSSTMLTKLETEAVETAYAVSQRQAEDMPTTIFDKQRAFAPLAHDLAPKTANLFTALLGLDPEVCEREMREFKENEQAHNERMAGVREKEREVEATLAAQAAAFRVAKQAEVDAAAREVAERERRIEEAHRSSVEASERERNERARREAGKLAVVKATLDTAVLKQKRKNAAAKGAETRAENAKSIPEWIPKKVEVLATAVALQRFGFLSPQAFNDRDVKAIESAKVEFAKFFAKPKDIAAVFETKEEFDKPGAEVLAVVARLRRSEKVEQE